jgi:hypothetical protein
MTHSNAVTMAFKDLTVFQFPSQRDLSAVILKVEMSGHLALFFFFSVP